MSEDHMTSRVRNDPCGQVERQAELQALLARVEAATGPDREIDTDICVVLHQYSDDGYERFGSHYPVGYYVAQQGIAPAYTSSLDATVELVGRVIPARVLADRVIPGWRFSVGNDLGGPKPGSCWARVFPPPREQHLGSGNCYAKTPALAVLAALLTALSAQSAT